MSDIPSEIFREILLRVPAEPLLRFRAVCKQWRRIIDDKCFVETHSKHEHFPFNFLIRNSIGSRFYSVSLDSLDIANGNLLITATPVKILVRRGVPRVPKFPVPSCNGLILIVNKFDVKKTWVIWNRLTREFHELPKPDTHLDPICFGFGYDCSKNDYKVVRVDMGVDNHVYKTHLYSLKLGSWKMIKDFPGDFRCCHDGVFLDGVLYWRAAEMIISLELETEDFSQIPLPPSPSNFHEIVSKHFDAMGGCLVFSVCYEEHLDIWVMNDCRIEKLWTKLFSSQKRDFQYGLRHYGLLHMYTLKPVTYLKSHGKVLLHIDKRFFWLDIKKKSIKKVKIRGLQGKFFDFSCQVCPGSLFRLDQSYDAKSRVPRKRKRRVERKEPKRLKIFVKNTNDVWHTSDSDIDYLSDLTWLSLDEECISDSMDP